VKKASAVTLFAITLATTAVMWEPAFWATSLPEVTVCALAAVWLIFAVLSNEKLQFSFVLIPLAGTALWPVLQLLTGVTINRWTTSVAALYWATNAAVVFIGLQIFSDAGMRRWYLRALVMAGFVIAVISPLQLFTGEGKIFWLFQTRAAEVAMGPFVYTNQYAAFIELVLPIALTLTLADRSAWRTFHGLAAVVMYASIFASTSRTGFILTSLEILIVPVLAARRIGIARRQLAILGTVFLSMLLILALAVGPDRLILKMQQKDPYFGRREYAESSLRMIPDRPLMGVGMGNWPAAYPAYAIFDEGYFANQAHNDWAQWTVEGGVPFALLMFLVAVWSLPKAFRTGWGIGVPIVFFQCLVDYPIQRMGVAVVFFTLIAANAFHDEPGIP
jgi:O-antigen ligase